MLRKFYAQVLIWSKHRNADRVLAVLALLEASILPCPPDLVMVSMSLAKPKRAFHYALVTTTFSVFGGLLGYQLGYHLWPLVQDFFFLHILSSETFDKIRDLYQDNLFSTVFIAGYTPLPYKIFNIAAGVVRVNLSEFLIAAILGRGLRFFMIATLIYYKGAKARRWIRLNLKKLLLVSSLFFITSFLLFKIYL